MKRFAIFFPQFHPVKVNDLAWGAGFTDWALVATANAFDYWERRAPVRGFYDLSKPEVVQDQFQTAAKAGLDGFGIYHYRFEDGPELEAVEQELLVRDPPFDFSYFFIWANENWSKRWAGRDTELLKRVATKPSLLQIRDHVAYLRPFMLKSCYTSLNGRPMFAVYRPDFFECPEDTIRAYRAEFQAVGLDPAIGFFLKSRAEVEYATLFDFCYLFEPRLNQNSRGLRRHKSIHWLARKLIHVFPYSLLERLSSVVGSVLKSGSSSNGFRSFMTYFGSDERQALVESIGCSVQNVLPSGWNNAPRYRDRFTELVEVPTPEELHELVETAIRHKAVSTALPLLCNAWNEWSEGAAIEPCSYLGDGLLKAYVGASTNARVLE